tara:strand:- start:168 stop:386 length:219 start_codon:yes stop_codon:yes gene_type:complete
MGVMIGTTIVVAILTLIGTVIWWAMMNDWEAKDRRARGRHITDHDRQPAARPGGVPTDQDRDDGEGPRIVKL